ncbi:MAG: AfsR/SARP family transcriptional regulator, partial [Catenulispora sp.]|nr:AfsR/SARP family transcriptional regulator [Catenulispora sp.]
MRYELLGAVRLTDQGDEYQVGSAKTGVLLSALLIRAGQVVPTSQLMTELWPQEPPAQAMGAVHVYVSQLRKLLRCSPSATSVIEACSPGYVLHTGSDERDFAVFWRRLRSARDLLRSGAAVEAAAESDAALDLWRGVRALGGLRGGPMVDGFTAWLQESRLECLELRIEANIAAGRHRETVGELYSLVDRHPLRESFYRLLMLALYRSNRQAHALRVYRRARTAVSDEFGVEPCPGLRDLQQAILSEDPRLRRAPAHRPRRGAGHHRSPAGR